MATPFGIGNGNFNFRQQTTPSLAANSNLPAENKTFNFIPNAGAKFEIPVGGREEESVQYKLGEAFAPNIVRTQWQSSSKPTEMLPPPPVPDILKRPHENMALRQAQVPIQHPARMAIQLNTHTFSPNIPPPLRGPPPMGAPPVNQHSFVNENNMMSMNLQPQIVHGNVCPGTKNQEADAGIARNLPKDEVNAQTQEDKSWLDHWLKKGVNRPCPPENQQSLSLSEIQIKTRQMLVLIAKLQKQKQILETLRDEDKSIWDQKVLEIERVKAELGQLQSYLTNEDTVAKLNKKITQRKKKRERLKRRRQEEYERHCELLEQREQKHHEIDRNLDKIHQKEKDAKQEKDLQKEVDLILGQVKKKITENTRAMQLLQGLEKLRQMRKDRQARQGIGIVGWESDISFSSKVESLKTVLDKQEQVYKAEESALQVILETEQEETREKEREKERQREVERQKKEEKRVEQALFGTFKEPRPDDPLYPFKQYYDAANSSFEAFLNIRHEWDKYLVLEGTPGGCRIPEDWVMPPEPASDIWASAVQDR